MEGEVVKQDICTRCQVLGVELRVGTASGRKHYKCPTCGGEWREKNLAAVAMGRSGGIARAEALSQAERSAQAEAAASARWAKEKQGLQPIGDRGVAGGKLFAK